MPASSNIPDFLVFQLYGNLASWGDIAVGEYRPAQTYPSKSAITGLLAAALGIRREEDAIHIDLNNHYGVAVCIQMEGELMRDYHTTQVPAGNKGWYSRKDELCFAPLELKTILSQRDYRMEAYYQVAVWIKDHANAPYSLEALAAALKKPVFTTYLGRKSCPPCLPCNPQILKELPLKQACESYPLADDFKYLGRSSKGIIKWYWEEGLNKEQSGLEPTMSYTHRDQISSRRRWQFANRKVFYFSEPKQNNNSQNNNKGVHHVL